MTCANCHARAARVRIVRGRERCAACGGFSEANGTRIDGVLSRQRTRDQGVKFEGDTINPWAYDRASRKFAPNDDFVRLHGANARNFYTPGDLGAYPKLAGSLYDRKGDGGGEAEGTGDEGEAMKEVVEGA